LSTFPIDNIDGLPGADLVRKGIADAQAAVDTREAALVQMAHAKLASQGFAVPAPSYPEPAGHRLYDLLSDDDRATAHSTYNALVGRLTSFLDALDHASAR
jgi:hypothetical protein